MNKTLISLRLQMATLHGFCQSARQLKPYGVPEDWIEKLNLHADRCNELTKEIIRTLPGDGKP